LLYAGWPAKGGISLLEEFHGAGLSIAPRHPDVDMG
jgi:hypothetical protein